MQLLIASSFLPLGFARNSQGAQIGVILKHYIHSYFVFGGINFRASVTPDWVLRARLSRSILMLVQITAKKRKEELTAAAAAAKAFSFAGHFFLPIHKS